MDRQTISLQQAADRAGISRSAVHRWITHGVESRDGMIRLRAVRVGGRWRTTLECLDEFVEKLTAASLGTCHEKVRL